MTSSFVGVSVALATLGGGIVLGALGLHFFGGRNAAAEEVDVTIDQIKAVAKLATIDYHGTVIERVTERHSWYEWKSAELLVEIHGAVEGLIDLEKISMERSPQKGVVTIVIPPEAIVIQDPIIDQHKGVHVTTLHDPNVFHKLTDGQRNQAIQHGIAHLKQKAIDSGIRAKTLEEAKHAITVFLERSGVEVRFAGNEPTAAGNSGNVAR